jgi:hypothetical protein
MTKNGGLIYLGIKNEHIQVCPNCGSTGFRKYTKKYEIVRSGLACYHNTRVKRSHMYFCRRCNSGFNNPDNLQSWLMTKFNEAREKERRTKIC